MSSRWCSLRTAPLLVAALAAAGLVSGCGSDHEAIEATNKPTHDPKIGTTSTAPATVPTDATSTSAAQRAKAQAKRRARARARAQARERERRRRAAAREAARRERTETTPPPVETTEQATPTPAPTPTPTPPPKPKPKPKPKPQGPPTHTISENATLQLVSKQGARAYVHQGAVQGTLVGTMLLNTKLGGEGVIGTFTVTLSDGTLKGRASARLTLAGNKANFSGTATILGGTGTYARASGSGLKFSGSVASDASTTTVSMAGQLRY